MLARAEIATPGGNKMKFDMIVVCSRSARARATLARQSRSMGSPSSERRALNSDDSLGAPDCEHGGPDDGESVLSNREFAVSETSSGSDGDSTWVGGPGLVGSLWRYRLVIVAVAALAAIAGYAASLLLPARYEAQASLYLRDPGSPAVLTLGGSIQSQSGDHAVFMATQAGLAGSDAVYGRALQILKRSGTPDDVRRSVAVEPSADLTSLTIRATSGDPVEAANLANAVGTAYEQVAGERIAADSEGAITRLQQVMAQREAEFDALRAQAAQVEPVPIRPALERKALHVADLIGAVAGP